MNRCFSVNVACCQQGGGGERESERFTHVSLLSSHLGYDPLKSVVSPGDKSSLT